MRVQRKPNKGADEPEELARVPLQAVLLADSFATKFRPITLERPKVLLPLVSVPMIDYSLAWLDSTGVEEVFVFCCAHSKQVTGYLESSQWLKQSNFSVTIIESHNAISAGDALRSIYERHVINGDFVLITGDTVSNISLKQALQEHKERRKKDSNAIMTMIIKQSKPSPITHQSRFGTDELFIATDPDTKQLLYYEDKSDNSKGSLTLEKGLFSDSSSISLHNDMQDCYIDICAPEVLSLFTDNFDYQHLRRHFVKGLLVDDIMGYKIFTHQIHSSYAAKVDNFRSYDTISKDIIQRWTYPLVPDVFGNCVSKLERQGMYRASDVEVSRSAEIGPLTVIGNGSKIGDRSRVSNSVIGEGCNIGSTVSIEGSYIWNNVTIGDGCTLRHSIVCDGVIMKPGAVLEPGVVLSFKVVIGEQFVVPAYSKVSLFQQPTVEDSDEELEYADSSSAEISPISQKESFPGGDSTSGTTEVHWGTFEVGVGGAGYIWSVCEAGQEEELRHSVAPITADKLAEITLYDENLELSQHNGSVLPPSGELTATSIDSGDDNEDPKDDSVYFEKEVEATFMRAVQENIKEDNIILEINSLRLSYNMTSADCADAVFYSIMKLAAEMPHSSNSDLQKNVAKVVVTWQKLLKYYMPSLDEEIEVILKFEEICLELVKEFSPLFSQILHFLYTKDVIQEEAILSWASEKEEADEADKVFLKQSESLIQWLKNASEEESGEDDDEE
ncbi:hypothetical protein Droror1_Dr00025419 [Drosera rotundifolia]